MNNEPNRPGENILAMLSTPYIKPVAISDDGRVELNVLNWTDTDWYCRAELDEMGVELQITHPDSRLMFKPSATAPEEANLLINHETLQHLAAMSASYKLGVFRSECKSRMGKANQTLDNEQEEQ